MARTSGRQNAMARQQQLVKAFSDAGPGGSHNSDMLSRAPQARRVKHTPAHQQNGTSRTLAYLLALLAGSPAAAGGWFGCSKSSKRRRVDERTRAAAARPACSRRSGSRNSRAAASLRPLARRSSSATPAFCAIASVSAWERAARGRGGGAPRGVVAPSGALARGLDGARCTREGPPRPTSASSRLASSGVWRGPRRAWRRPRGRGGCPRTRAAWSGERGGREQARGLAHRVGAREVAARDDERLEARAVRRLDARGAQHEARGEVVDEPVVREVEARERKVVVQRAAERRDALHREVVVREVERLELAPRRVRAGRGGRVEAARRSRCSRRRRCARRAAGAS